MKVLQWTSILLGSAVMLFTSCSSSEDEPVVQPVFPDMATLSIPAGETTCEVTFTPNLDWTVSIPTDSETAQWFDLLDGEMAVSSISGKASTTPVTVTVVTSEQELFDEAPVCEVSLTMGGETKVIAKITRGTTARTFDLYASVYDENEDDFIMPFEFSESALEKYSGEDVPETAPEGAVALRWPLRVGGYMYVFKSKSNFEYLASVPAWLEVSKTAIEGEDGAYQIMVNGLFTEDNIDGGVGIIDFYDANIDNTEDPGNNAHNRYCVTMPAFRDLVKHDANNAVFAFNAEGQYSSTTAGTEVVDDYATAGVSSTAGLKFFVLMPDGYGGYYAAKEKTGWVTVTDDMWDETGEIFQHRDYTIAVTANSGAARSAVLVALPQTLAAEIDENGDLDAQLLKADGSYDLKDEYKPYAFATVEQEAPASGSGDEGLSVICPTDATTQYYLDNGFFKFEELTEGDPNTDEDVAEFIGEIESGAKLYRLTYNSQSMSEGSLQLQIKGEYNMVMTYPYGNEWLVFYDASSGMVDAGNFVIGDTDGKTVEEVQAKYRAGADVNCEKAWERTTGDPSIVVAVLDEGIYWRHPDLVNNMWENEDEPYYSDAAGEHVSYEDRDGNGYAGDHFGYDFINNTGVISCDASSDTGHGTHVAGVIAARNTTA